MLFTVLPRDLSAPSGSRNCAFLIEDRWDDWGKYQTQHWLFVFDQDGHEHKPGAVKIGERGLLPSDEITPGSRAPSIPRGFEALDDRFISLGQDENFYEALNAVPEVLRRRVLTGLRDCAYNTAIFDAFSGEEVMRESLLRSVSTERIRNRFHRLAHGNAVLNEFYFEYKLPSGDGDEPPPTVKFHVKPASEPPTNVHVLIGRNGVGKTRCMQGLARALVLENPDEETSGSIDLRSDLAPPPLPPGSQGWSFAGLVAVTFSAFDSFTLPRVSRPGMSAKLVGLRRSAEPAEPTEPGASPMPVAPIESTSGQNEIPKSFSDDFCRSLALCRAGPRRDRLRAALATLSNDPLFAEAAVIDLLDRSDDEWRREAEDLFKALSSGHAIVLLTITRLVELVDERTIVLFDEPEGHLHPPLLSAFIRALSDLLVKRNGVALISTHSPVVLQEVPQSCVWILNRFGSVAKADRPSIETFGENVGVLTREVFKLEVTNSGFHKLLQRAIENPANDYDAILAHFGGQLGAEAKGIVRSLLAVRNRQGTEEGA